MTKFLTISTLALSLMGGVAFAQDASSGTTGAGSAAGTTNAPNAPMPFLSNPENRARFFTDDTMTTMRSDDEVRAAFEAMSDEERSVVGTECTEVNKTMRSTFCDAYSKNYPG